jgi:hypothetical protein
MEKVLLVDADSKIPNIALMKLSRYHKDRGDQVDFVRLNLSGYGPSVKSKKKVKNAGYDRTYASVVFTRNANSIQYETDQGLQVGGSGADLAKRLPIQVDVCREDYSLYPENDKAWGFITRGCIRKCSFCFVPKKEGALSMYQHPAHIIRPEFPITMFLDNNFLAYEQHEDILRWLIENNTKCQFNQGLDLRLLNEHNVELLSRLRYYKEFIFAFDHISYVKSVEEKVALFRRYNPKPWKIKLFILVGYNSTLEEDLWRIDWCIKNNIYPYVMRHAQCWESPDSLFYIDLAAWTNQNKCVKSMTFEEFLPFRQRHGHITVERQDRHIELYRRIMTGISI